LAITFALNLVALPLALATCAQKVGTLLLVLVRPIILISEPQWSRSLIWSSPEEKQRQRRPQANKPLNLPINILSFLPPSSFLPVSFFLSLLSTFTWTILVFLCVFLHSSTREWVCVTVIDLDWLIDCSELSHWFFFLSCRNCPSNWFPLSLAISPFCYCCPILPIVSWLNLHWIMGSLFSCLLNMLMDCIEVSEISGVGLHFPLVGFPVSVRILTLFAWSFSFFNFFHFVLPLSSKLYVHWDRQRSFVLEKRKSGSVWILLAVFVAIRCAFTVLIRCRMSRSLVLSFASFCQRRHISPVCFSPPTPMSSTVLYFQPTVWTVFCQQKH